MWTYSWPVQPHKTAKFVFRGGWILVMQVNEEISRRTLREPCTDICVFFDMYKCNISCEHILDQYSHIKRHKFVFCGGWIVVMQVNEEHSPRTVREPSGNLVLIFVYSLICLNVIFLVTIFMKAKPRAPGPDGIHNNLLKHLPKDTLKILKEILNMIWISADFPQQWRAATVIPIPKPNKDHTDPLSYCPIALTRCLCKVPERMINARLIWYLTQDTRQKPVWFQKTS